MMKWVLELTKVHIFSVCNQKKGGKKVFSAFSRNLHVCFGCLKMIKRYLISQWDAFIFFYLK